MKKKMFLTTALLALITVVSPVVSFAQFGGLGDTAKAKAVEKLTNSVMNELEKKFTEVVAKEPISAEAKANIVKRLSETSRPIVDNYINSASSGKLPNPADLSKKVLNDILPQVQGLVAASLTTEINGTVVNPAQATSSAKTSAQPTPVSATPCLCGITCACAVTATNYTATQVTQSKTPAVNNIQSESVVVFTGNGHKYEVIDKSITWTKARDDCKKRGGYLVTITDEEEQQFILNLLSKQGKSDNYWIGGYREKKDWKWVTGENFSYSNWAPGEPNNHNGEENRAMFSRVPLPGSTQGKWNDRGNINEAYGSMSFGYICEWD